MCNTKEILECAHAWSYKYLLQQFCIHIILVGLFFAFWHRLRQAAKSAAKSFERVLIKFREKWKLTNFLRVHILGERVTCSKIICSNAVCSNLKCSKFRVRTVLCWIRSNMFKNLKTKYNLKYVYYYFN